MRCAHVFSYGWWLGASLQRAPLTTSVGEHPEVVNGVILLRVALSLQVTVHVHTRARSMLALSVNMGTARLSVERESRRQYPS